MEIMDKLMEVVENSPSYKKIMADGIVEDREVEEQAQLVTSLFEQIEKRLSEEDLRLVSKCMAELSVLNVVYRLNQSQM